MKYEIPYRSPKMNAQAQEFQPSLTEVLQATVAGEAKAPQALSKRVNQLFVKVASCPKHSDVWRSERQSYFCSTKMMVQYLIDQARKRRRATTPRRWIDLRRVGASPWMFNAHSF